MLSPDQRRDFEERGFVRIAEAFPAESARAMEERVWSFLGKRFDVSPTDPATWKLPLGLGLQGMRTHPVFAPIGSDATVGALDELLGQGRWVRPTHWGQFLVTFPTDPCGAWTVPWRVWHTDFPMSLRPDPLPGVLLFCFLSEVPQGHGGTLVVAGSHRLVGRFAAARSEVVRAKMKVARRAFLRSAPWLQDLSSESEDSDRVERFMNAEGEIEGVPVRVVELTGAPGDVVIAHPWLLHASGPNCGECPRFMRVQRIRTHPT